MKDYYRTLQVNPSAEPEVVEAAYRRLARKYHPDVNRNSDAAQRMRELNEAYEVLHDVRSRQAYDVARQVEHDHGRASAENEHSSPAATSSQMPTSDLSHSSRKTSIRQSVAQLHKVKARVREYVSIIIFIIFIAPVTIATIVGFIQLGRKESERGDPAATLTATRTAVASSLAQEVYVSTLAGSGVLGSDEGPSFRDGPGNQARFRDPRGVAIDVAGNTYVADAANHRIRKVTPSGEVVTFAGSGAPGFLDGQPANAQFSGPAGVAVDSAGVVYVADWNNNRIRRITPDGIVSTLAGGHDAGSLDGPVTSARFNRPTGVAVDGDGNVYVADFENHRVRKITSGGTVTTVAGTGGEGHRDGPGRQALFRHPTRVVAASDGSLYVADTDNHRIRRISPTGDVSTFAGSGERGYADGTAATAKFSRPAGMALDSSGNLYVSDYDGNRIRKVSPNGEVGTLAGSGEAGIVDGQGERAEFANPDGLALDQSGNILVADASTGRIRRVISNQAR